MTTKYKKYPEYKDSGLDWLGEIPSHWEVFQSRRIFKNLRNKAYKDDEQLAASQKYGVIPQKLMMELNNSKVMLALKGTESFKHVEKDNFVISLRSFEGGIEHSEYKGCVSPAYTVLEASKPISVGYYKYLFKSKQFIAALQSTTDSLRDGKSITYEQFGKIDNVYISESEGRQIEIFIDYETNKIDSQIEKQEKLIKLLKEKRQAVISHAVTKGLNSDVTMKDSGFEWLGKIPEHWTICRLKHVKSNKPNAFVDGPFGSNLKSEHFIEDGEVYVIESNFATTGKISKEKLKKISLKHYETIKRSATEEGDIIIAKIGARYGMSSILPKLDKKSVVSGNSLKLTVDTEKVNIDYTNELLKVLRINDAMDEGVNITAQPALSLGSLNNLIFLKPPINEQKDIMTFVNEKNIRFSSLIKKATNQIQLLKERRTSLISAAITGKIDVREWVRPE